MDSVKYTAVVFGASGLTGKFITEHLIADKHYEQVKLFVRKEFNINHGKVRQVVFNPENILSISEEITGDHLFCCIGTTIKKAGSRDVFFNTDHDLVEKIAKVASSNKIKSFVVISSIGASDNSRNFYLNTKGKMEESIRTFTFDNLSIVRPSMLLGIRRERRPLEEIGKMLAKVISPLFIGSLKKYKAIHASTVAKAMINLAKRPKGIYIVESDELEKIALEK